MTLKTTVKAAVLLLSFSLIFTLFACGELSTPLFPSDGTYQVKAMVNGSSLDNCSIIRQNDKIIPYFAVSVVNDPDLVGLLVYLQNANGDIVGNRVLYTIEPVDEAVPSETPYEKTEAEDRNSGKTEDGTAGEEENNETDGQAEPEIPKQVTEKQASLSTNAAKPAGKKYDTVILIKSFGQEMPYFPLSKNMEIGTYTLIFEAVGRSHTLSLTESDIFYLGNVEFRLNDISLYLPWRSDTRLIPPGVTVMLEAGLDFDSRLDPYVIWYNGRNIISEGKISEGAGKILWKVPGQSDFYSLRLEVFPYQLKRKYTGIFREITIPVSKKASQTNYFFAADADKAATAPIPAASSDLLRWFRFDGSLDEASLIPERKFEAENRPRWAAVEQSYGLSAGPNDTYLLRPVSFFRNGQKQGGGVFLFCIKPAAEGTFFSAFFPTIAAAGAPAQASDGVWMDMSTRENAVTLRLRTRRTTVEIPVNPPGYIMEKGLVPITVEFYIRPYSFEAKLSLGEDHFIQSMTGEIRLPEALSGEGRIKLGADKTAPAGTTDGVAETKSVQDSPNFAGYAPAETARLESINADNKTSATSAAAATTIWDEFAVLYSGTPLLSEKNMYEEAPEKEEQSGVILHRNEALTEQEQAETENKETASFVFSQ